MSKRFNEQQKIGDILHSFILDNKLEEGINQILITETWYSVMGNGIKNYTTNIVLKGDKLLVFLSSSVVREELSYGKEKIIRLLNEELKRDLIKELILK
jgi:hypothetical protein